MDAEEEKKSTAESTDKQAEASKSDFETELSKQNVEDTKEYANKQEYYKQMLPNYGEVVESPYAWRIGFGRRLAAYLLDFVFLSFLLVGFSFLTNIMNEMTVFMSEIGNNLQSMEVFEEFNNFILRRFMPFYLAISAIYYSTEIFFAATPGKMILGIMIGDASKKNATILQLLLRFFVKNISTIFTFLALVTAMELFSFLSSSLGMIIFIGCFGALSERRQALHDIIAKTAVYFKDELKQFQSND